MTVPADNEPSLCRARLDQVANKALGVANGVNVLAAITAIVVSILALTNVLPGGLPLAITIGAAGVVVAGVSVLNLFKANDRKFNLCFHNPLWLRISSVVACFLFGGTLITLGTLHGISVVQATTLLTTHQLATGTLAVFGIAFFVNISMFVAHTIHNRGTWKLFVNSNVNRIKEAFSGNVTFNLSQPATFDVPNQAN